MRLVTLGILLSCLFLGRTYDRYRRDRLRVTFFDVGQGDASLVELPGGEVWLIDAGGGSGDWEVGSRVLLRELLRLGIFTVDKAILSHPDQDHGYGFFGILGELSVREFVVNRSDFSPAKKPLALALLRLAEVRGAETTALALDLVEKWPWGSAHWVALSEGKKTNNRSLVLVLDYAGCSVVFTGDIEGAAEAELARRIRTPRGSVLLKVAHHGSKTSSSSDFLKMIRPRWAVISSGRGNSYGHPHAEAMARLKSTGAQLLRTDFHGFTRFTFHSDGQITCETAHGPCGHSQCRPQK